MGTKQEVDFLCSGVFLTIAERGGGGGSGWKGPPPPPYFSLQVPLAPPTHTHSETEPDGAHQGAVPALGESEELIWRFSQSRNTLSRLL